MSKELVNKHGVVRICSRCKKLAVRRVKSEWLCRTCLEERKKRQLRSAMQPKCASCYCNAKLGDYLCGACSAKVEQVARDNEERRLLYNQIRELEDSNLQEILHILLDRIDALE